MPTTRQEMMVSWLQGAALEVLSGHRNIAWQNRSSCSVSQDLRIQAPNEALGSSQWPAVGISAES